MAGGVAASHLPPVERKMQVRQVLQKLLLKLLNNFLIKIIQVGEEQMDQLADSLVSST